MDEKALNILLSKFTANVLTEKEHQEFIDWLHQLPEDRAAEVLEKYASHFEQLPENNSIPHPELMDRIQAEIDQHEGVYLLSDHTPTAEQEQVYPLWRYAGVAVALLFMCSIAFYFLQPAANSSSLVKDNHPIVQIIPGSDKATLTTGNGEKMVLSRSSNALLAGNPQLGIDQVSDGELIYGQANPKSSSSPAMNVLSTPRGGKYKVTLPDGTKVWLNAGTVLKYPSAFTGKKRLVELIGEAYFEVAKNKSMPFVVNVNHTQVTVLGTHFNVMAYADEPAVQTTLLEGSVHISDGQSGKLIVPGEQAIVMQGIKVIEVDTAQVIGWKNGNFTFYHEDIRTVMNKIARWYDVDIEYRGNITKEQFVGVIPRSKDLSAVLHTLELTGLIHFKINERRIVVME